MRYLSVCSGIESASVAWQPLGWQAAAFSEIEPYPCALLKHHYPDVPNWGDMTKFKEWPDADIDLLVGGTPCQSFSVAGLRKGLDDPRGNLMLTYLAIAGRYRPRWLVWENVPGVLSSNGGRDFGTFLGGLAELGYGFAYRVLDAQYYGVAQRRRRVFVAGYLGDWRRAAAVLFERHSLSGHPAPSREAGQGFTHDVAPCLTSSGRGVERTGDSRGQDPVISMAHGQGGAEVRTDGGAPTLTCNHEAPIAAYAVRTANTGANGHGISPELCPTLDGANGQAVAFNARQDPVSGDVAGALDTSSPQAQAVAAFQPGNLSRGAGAAPSADVFPTLKADHGRSFSDQSPHVCADMAVRRLTPIECERLQGFPDNYTNVPFRGKPAADGHRYKALGNSKAVPVVRWIGERIAAVETISN